ncbi:MAG: VOC family protein, partial [Nitrospirales bacterium]
MKSRIKVLTLGVSDLEKSLTFYRDGLGLPTEGIIGTEFEEGAVVFFRMNDDLILALYPKVALAKDAKLPVSPPSPTEFSIGHIVKSKQEVDAIMKQAHMAGAKVTDPAHDRFWGGYSGYFQDLDG